MELDAYTIDINNTIRQHYFMCVQQVGGFRLPFVSSGAAILAVGALAWLLLPPQTGPCLIICHCTGHRYHNRNSYVSTVVFSQVMKNARHRSHYKTN